MQIVRSIELDFASREEVLPGFSRDFPYIATCARLDDYLEPAVPWHWHRTVELFYMDSGTLEYTTPGGTWTFSAGSGGMVNANVLHMSRVKTCRESNIQCLHLFDPAFLAGEQGSRIEEKYILPLTTSPGIELIGLYPDEPEHKRVLDLIKSAFTLSEEQWGYEFRLRQKLEEIWLALFELARPAMEQSGGASDAQIKTMMIYIHEHFREELTVDGVAAAGHVSKRACFRLFRDKLHMTPLAYIRSIRMREACRLLCHTRDSVTQIAGSCGLGTGSYFGKVFREEFGCTPAQYRSHWHDRDKKRHKTDSNA